MAFEKKLKRLEEIVNKMESGDLSLDDSLKLFEEGVKLSRECNDALSQAELKVKTLMEVDENSKMKTQDFLNNSEE